MLEDELREMFAARVHVPPPAAVEPARRAIRKGRRAARRRQTAAGMAAVVAFVTALGAAADARNLEQPQGDSETITFQSLFGGVEQLAAPADGPEPTLDLPVDVRVGNELWTADGRRLSLSSAGDVGQVVSVPTGWVYSDASAVRLLTRAGTSVPLTGNAASWAVSTDGAKLATVADKDLRVSRISDKGLVPGAVTKVPVASQPVTFHGDFVLLYRGSAGFDSWSATNLPYTEGWDSQLLAVFGSGKDATALRKADGTVCLVELTVTTARLRAGTELGCGEVLTTAVSRAVESPDGRWLAVSSGTGVHMIDVFKAREAAVGKTAQDQHNTAPVVAWNCAARPDAPMVWADDITLLTVSAAAGIVACRTDGTRLLVPLPAGVTKNWELVPAYGVTH